MAHDFDLVIALGSTQTGLTLTASVRDAAGSALGSQPAYTIVEQGGGWYSYHTSAMPDGQRGVVRILSGAAVMAVGVVTPVESENADVKTSTRGTGTSTYAGGDTSGTTTLLSRLTSGRAILLDNMDAAVTTRAPAATALTNATWTDARAGFLDAAITSRMATFTYTAPPSAADNLAAWKADADVITLLAIGAALDLMIVTDGAGAYEFTVGALANAPTGGGSSLTAADVWAHGTRTLTAGTNIVLAKGVGVTGFTDLSAAQVNAEADAAIADAALATSAALAAAKADTAAILVDTAELQADWADGGRLDLLLDAAAAGGTGGTVTLDLSQTGFTPRALDDVEDGEITLGDCLIAGLVGAVGDFARSGVTLVKKTPATNTVVRTLTFDSIAAPTSRT